MLHLAEMDADIGTGGLARQFELVGLEATDLVAQAVRTQPRTAKPAVVPAPAPPSKRP